ncbi:nicotinamide N-methyltransferase-like isoform X2 [Dysidea avara]|uniref:nicotinamide N-methyltransferase-like isoform X2 n=1 Tax=Dysidea avara TaxID=196820 RepID=UPI0033263C71
MSSRVLALQLFRRQAPVLRCGFRALRLLSSESMQSSDMDINEERYGNTKRYLTERYPPNPSDKNAAVVPGSLLSPLSFQFFHNFYQKYHKEWDSSTAFLLDVGGGPCIYPHISAIPYVAKIYHTDFVKAMCDEVLLWKNKDPNAFDWSPYFKHVVQELEGQTSPKAVTEREDKLRTILNVGPCDAKADVIVPGLKEPVDILSSSFCLEACPESLEEYVAILKRLCDLIVPRGFFISQSALENSWYKLGKLRYDNPCPLSLEDIKRSYQEAGFDVLYVDQRDKPMAVRNISNGCTGYGYFIAQKQ